MIKKLPLEVISKIELLLSMRAEGLDCVDLGHLVGASARAVEGFFFLLKRFGCPGIEPTLNLDAKPKEIE